VENGGDPRGVQPAPGYILVVDDDAAIREALTLVLEDEGYTVRSAANGRDALQLLRANEVQPQVILLDLMMPVMSGWDFRAEQQRDPTLAAIPVVVLSADRSLQTKAAMVQAQGYLAKPVDISVLIDMVSRYCS
jgi:CheY-like chemotaxis protein